MVKSIAYARCLGLVAFFALTALPARALPLLPDPEKGEALAQHWCAACHLVSPDQKTANSDVPSFASIANNKKLTAKTLQVFLSTPHPKMPDMHLSRSEIADIVAYIESLGR